MKRSCEITGLTVVSIQEGKELGTVQQLVVDPAGGKIAALLVNDGTWYLGAKILPFSSINGLGEYAVTINSETDIMSVTPSSVFDNLLSQDITIVGSLAVTRNGNASGTVSEIIIDADGTIAECLIEESGEIYSLSAQRVITYGKDILIISAEGELQARTGTETVVTTTLSPVFTDISTAVTEEAEAVQAEAVPTEAVQAEVIPEAVQEAVPAAETVPDANVSAEQETDALAKMFEEKQRKYLLGKTASRRIEAENGVVVIEQGEEITEAVLQKAKLAGKFVELSMSIY